MYYGWHYGWHRHVVDVWDPSLAIASVLLATMGYCVYRLWRGMRLDSFEKNLRTLRQQPQRRIQPQHEASQPRSGLGQISLLGMMLIACGLAILLAQAQRPDELSRPLTWTLFVVAGGGYGIHAWRHVRGFGPLRNDTLAGSAAAGIVSALLWMFYMGVDRYWSVLHDTPAERITARLPQLLWWTAMGATIGAMLGSIRAHRRSNQLQLADSDVSTMPVDSPRIDASPMQKGSRRRSALWVGCVASLLFHLSAAPQLNRVVDVRHQWFWGDTGIQPSTNLTLTMAAPHFELPELAAHIDVASYTELDDGAYAAYHADEGQGQTSEQPMIVTPTRDIARGETLRAVDFRRVPAPMVSGTTGQIVESMTELAGHVAAVDLAKDSVVPYRFLRSTQQYGSGPPANPGGQAEELQPLAPIIDLVSSAAPSPETGSPQTTVVRPTPDNATFEGFVRSAQSNRFEVTLGADDGVEVGQELKVFRDKTLLGRAVVRFANLDYAVAESLPADVTVQRGDRVTTGRVSKLPDSNAFPSSPPFPAEFSPQPDIQPEPPVAAPTRQSAGLPSRPPATLPSDSYLRSGPVPAAGSDRTAPFKESMLNDAQPDEAVAPNTSTPGEAARTTASTDGPSPYNAQAVDVPRALVGSANLRPMWLSNRYPPDLYVRTEVEGRRWVVVRLTPTTAGMGLSPGDTLLKTNTKPNAQQGRSVELLVNKTNGELQLLQAPRMAIGLTLNESKSPSGEP